MQLRKRLCNDRFCLAFLYLVYLVALFLASSFTSPLYPHLYGDDSALFSLLGKGVLEGKLLYIDLFDHKGPLIFFINALGQLIGGHMGIFLLQYLFGCVSMTFLYHTAKILKPTPKSPWERILLFTFAYIVFFYTFEQGNLTEEYSQPFISCALYFLVKYAANCDKNAAHPPLYSFIYGIALGVLAFLRLNNSVTVCAGVLAVAVYLVYKKAFKNLLLNILAGLAGLAVIAIPICLYFHLNSALYSMLYATFLYNLNIVGDSGQYHFMDHISTFSILFMPLVVCCVLLCVHVIRSRKMTFLDSLLACILFFNFLMFILANRFPHYFNVFVPVYLVFLLRYCTVDKKRLITYLVILCTAVNLLRVGWFTASSFNACHISQGAETKYVTVHNAISMIPEAERDSVIGYQIPVSYYVMGDIVPCYKYYTWQESWSQINPQVVPDFMEWVRSEQPLWVLTTPGEDSPELAAILQQSYEVSHENELLICYRLKDAH